MENGYCIFCLDKFKIIMLNKCVMCPKQYQKLTFCDKCFDTHTKYHIQKTEHFFNETYTKDDIVSAYKLDLGNSTGFF
jgi:peptidase E